MRVSTDLTDNKTIHRISKYSYRMSSCGETLGIVVEWMSKKDLESEKLCPKCFNKKV